MVAADSDRIPRVPPYSGGTPRRQNLPVRGFHPLRPDFPDGSSSSDVTLNAPTTPRTPRRARFRLFPVRSPLLRESIFLSLPAGTKMFQFPAFAPCNHGIRSSTVWVAPFGNLRISSCLQIPGAYRSLPRPSSPSEAKASSVRSCSLSRTFSSEPLATSLCLK